MALSWMMRHPYITSAVAGTVVLVGVANFLNTQRIGFREHQMRRENQERSKKKQLERLEELTQNIDSDSIPSPPSDSSSTPFSSNTTTISPSSPSTAVPLPSTTSSPSTDYLLNGKLSKFDLDTFSGQYQLLIFYPSNWAFNTELITIHKSMKNFQTKKLRSYCHFNGFNFVTSRVCSTWCRIRWRWKFIVRSGFWCRQIAWSTLQHSFNSRKISPLMEITRKERGNIICEWLLHRH